MRTRTREIAKVGIYGSKDDPQIVTEKDLLEIAETFPEIQSAPVTFGHWGNPESPRLGNVTSVTYHPETKSLTAEIQEDDTLAAAVEAGYYPDVSIRSKQRASDGKMYLVHLAYLGQEAPAIKDLTSSVQDALGIAASETAGLREFPPPSGKQLYLSDTPQDNLLPKNINQSKEASMTEAEAQKLREENERLKREAEEKDLALSDAARRRRAAEKLRLKSVMDEKGIINPVREKVFSLLDSFEGGKTIELSDSEAQDGKRNVSPADCLIEIMSGFSKPVEPGVLNLSEGEAAGESGALDFAKI